MNDSFTILLNQAVSAKLIEDLVQRGHVGDVAVVHVTFFAVPNPELVAGGQKAIWERVIN